MTYVASAGQELQKIVNYLEYEIKNMKSDYYSFYLSEATSKRLKKTSKKLDVLSKRVERR